ncbi:MIT (microtubule interacting and transport) domain [Geosmithia morbida]|uniref:MIT (Microtubule interacting and transport) domain n=1 Tax=Geosmithia morbida TaxID=1094350 RepID=A0A9P4YZJ9_9HYPO|nr:MIT (microtubule interacting and transport) domain [Geosmithia morbida]KAF4125961.1 MIT (microtubule interacting and transport) domain [Geosmithia morbida]
MQASKPPYNDSIGHTRSRPSLPSQSLDRNDEAAAQPRLPPPDYILQPTTYAPSLHRAEPETAAAPRPGARNQSFSDHRWSASTGSSRGNSETASRGRRNSTVDTSFFLTSSPPTTRTPPRKLQKNRRPSVQSHGSLSPLATRSLIRADANHQNYTGLPSLDPLSSLAQDYSTALQNQQRQQPSHRLSRSLSQILPQSNIATSMQTDPFADTMHKEQPDGHSQNRSGKGSSDSSNPGAKPPSQKAMLSHALQKANAAVQLDNNQDIWGARQAYGEACDLLQNVLQRTSAQEDKRKLDAIRCTYTSRIDELDQLLSWQDTKALPPFPETQQENGNEDEPVYAEIATLVPAAHDDGQIGRQEARVPRAEAQYQMGSLEPGILQSSFSRSPARSPHRESVAQHPGDLAHTAHAYASTGRQTSSAADFYDTGRSSQPSGFSTVSESENGSRGIQHVREESQNSWLDPIDESGGSTVSSVHSRTSSLGYRRRHIRPRSGGTEAEFDTALDAAIEAAYDDGYEPTDSEGFRQKVDSDDEIVANALRRVELARQRVRQTELEAYEMASKRERERFQLQSQSGRYTDHREDPYSREGFYEDNSSDEEDDEEEERIFEEMTHSYASQGRGVGGPPRKPALIPRQSDSSGVTSHTWQSSIGSNPPGTGTTSLFTVAEAVGKPIMPTAPAPRAPPPSQALPEIPGPRPPSSAQSVRNRRLSGQNPKQLKIDTAVLGPPPPAPSEETTGSNLDSHEAAAQALAAGRADSALRRPTSPETDARSGEARPPSSPYSHRVGLEGDDYSGGRSSSPSVSKLKKNFSASSLRSLKTRNMSFSHPDEVIDMSPVTPSTAQWGNMQWGTSKAPAIPTLPAAVATSLREKAEAATGGMYLLDDNFHSMENTGSPGDMSPDAPVPLEPCPTDFMLRPFWLMRCLYQTLVHPRGGYLSSKLFVPRDAWKVKGVKLKNVDDKIANCDYLTAALLKLARVDTFDADAMLEEMQSMETVLENTQAALTRKLGNEVGVNSAGSLFKEAQVSVDGDAAPVPRSTSVTGKSSFSWRRLRSKNSSTALSAQNRRQADETKETQNLPTLPMTAQPTSKPAKRDVEQVQFTGPNANYMGSLARLFDAVQVIDQIARQVEDPGLRHADKTQVGLELCTRHAAEFFGFYICRFVLVDIGLLMDKFIKRGSEWVLA